MGIPTPSPITSSPSMSVSPSEPCIVADASVYQCGNPITVDFNFEDALITDWIGIYPCEDEIFLHSVVWQWSCGSPFCDGAVQNGSIVFDSLPPYNVFGPHSWPVKPYNNTDGTVNRCFKAVLLRADGPSVPPYVSLCESNEFIIEENDSEGCQISPEKPGSEPSGSPETVPSSTQLPSMAPP